MFKVSIEDVANVHEIFMSQSLKCFFDQKIPINPVMCSQCETIFCIDCIDHWKKTNRHCPNKCSNMLNIPIDRTILKEELNKMKLFCKNNKYGCKAQLLVSEIIPHYTNCTFKPDICPKCKEEICVDNKLNHYLKDCKGLNIPCFICSKDQSFQNSINHLIECLSDKANEENLKELELFKNTLSICAQCGCPEYINSLNDKTHKCFDSSKIEILKAHLKNLNFKKSSDMKTYQSEFEKKIKKFLFVFNESSKLILNIMNDYQQKKLKQLDILSKTAINNIIKIKNEKRVKLIELKCENENQKKIMESKFFLTIIRPRGRKIQIH